MGGKGASSGWSVDKNGRKLHKYGTEYRTLLSAGEIKFVQYNLSESAKTPKETMTPGRVYVTVNAQGNLKAVTFYDKNNRKYKQIDLSGQKHIINGEPTLPHTHFGYEHDEYKPDGRSPKNLTDKERKLIDKIKKIWKNRHSK